MLCVGTGHWVAGVPGAVVGGLLTILFFALTTYPLTYVATILAGRVIRIPTFFSASFVAKRTTIGFCVGLFVLLVSAVAEQLLRPSETGHGEAAENILTALTIFFVLFCSCSATWSSSKHHSEYL